MSGVERLSKVETV